MLRNVLIMSVALWAADISQAATWGESMFDELVKDFGHVPRGPAVTHPFRVTNKTKSPMHISSVRVSCGCVSASVTKEEIGPGESTVVNARMDTTRFTGPKSVTVYVQIDRPQWEEVRLVVQANGRDDFALNPESLAFGQVRYGVGGSQTVTISYYGNASWKLLDAKAESNYVQPKLTELRREGGDVKYQLSANVRADVPIGKWYTDIWLTTNDPNLSKIRVPLTIEVEQSLTITPTAATMGQVKSDSLIERKIIIKGDKPFRILGVKGTDDNLKVKYANPESKAVHLVTVELKTTKLGEQKWVLRVQTDLKNQAEVSFVASAEVVP